MQGGEVLPVRGRAPRTPAAAGESLCKGERYCRGVLGLAVAELEEDGLARHHLEAEYTEAQGVIDDLTLVTGILKLSR
jgi:hypothetical protein